MGWTAIKTAVETFLELRKKAKTKRQDESLSHLNAVINNIKETSEEDISLDNLKKAKVEKARYRFSDTGFPIPIRQKYISVPSNSEYNNLGSISLVQEKKMFSSKRVLYINK